MKSIFSDLKDAASKVITHRLNRRVSVVVVLTVFCAALAARAHHAWKSESPAINLSVAPRPIPATAAQDSPGESVRIVKFNLFEGGIYPREVHVDKGLLSVTIEDYSGGTSGLVIERQTGAVPEHAGLVGRSDAHWKAKSQVKLNPGQYVVYMSDRPENRALLVVEP